MGPPHSASLQRGMTGENSCNAKSPTPFVPLASLASLAVRQDGPAGAGLSGSRRPLSAERVAFAHTRAYLPAHGQLPRPRRRFGSATAVCAGPVAGALD